MKPFFYLNGFSTRTSSISSGRLLTALIACCLITGNAYADTAGDNILAAVDSALNRAKSQYLEYEIINQEPDKNEKKLAETVWIMGQSRRIEFIAPPDLKGTKVLILSPTQMYVYLPAFGKVRRIASRVKDKSFLGMAFSQDDFVTSYSGSYNVSIASATPTMYQLVLVSKSAGMTAYDKIEMTVARDHMVPTELRYFDETGTKIKTETRSGYTCQDDICDPQERKMVDNTRASAWTKLLRKVWRVNERVDENLFKAKLLGGQ